MNAAIAEYAKAKSAQGMGVTPHRLVSMLMQSALDKLAASKGCLDRGDFVHANENITTVMTIVTTLKSSLDMEEGGDISINLDLLYGYMNTQLLEAMTKHDNAPAEEVAGLLRELANGWNAMPDNIKNATDLSQIAN